MININKTVVYVVRHSEKYRNREYYDSKDSFQINNEKIILTYQGEIWAETLSANEEFKNFSAVYASNYVRSLSTAKHFAEKNSINVKIMDDFGERKIGINSYDEYPDDFEFRQFQDENYKIDTGESRKETTDRMYNALMRVIDENMGSRILVISHATAMSCLFSKWCDVKYEGEYTFNGKAFFDGH